MAEVWRPLCGAVPHLSCMFVMCGVHRSVSVSPPTSTSQVASSAVTPCYAKEMPRMAGKHCQSALCRLLATSARIQTHESCLPTCQQPSAFFPLPTLPFPFGPSSPPGHPSTPLLLSTVCASPDL